MDIATRQIICGEIIKGKEAEAFRDYKVSDLDQAILRKCAHEIMWTVVARRAPFRRYWKAPIRNPIKWGILISALFAIIALAFAARIIPLIDFNKPETYPLATAAAALYAIAAATSGWAVTSIITARNARINHSLTIVSDRFAKSEFSSNTYRFNVAFKGRKITKALIGQMIDSNDEADREGVQALRYLLNYFEYVAVGVLLGELDETIIRKTIRGNLIHYYDRCASYIQEEQRLNPKVLENLTMLRAHFRDV